MLILAIIVAISFCVNREKLSAVCRRIQHLRCWPWLRYIIAGSVWLLGKYFLPYESRIANIIVGGAVVGVFLGCFRNPEKQPAQEGNTLRKLVAKCRKTLCFGSQGHMAIDMQLPKQSSKNLGGSQVLIAEKNKTLSPSNWRNKGAH